MGVYWPAWRPLRRWNISTPRLNVVGALLAFLVVAILVLPWPSPFPEVILNEFDQNLVTVNESGLLENKGEVSVDSREIFLSTKPGSQPIVHLITSKVPFSVAFSVTVYKRALDAFPFQVKLWNPHAEVAVEAWYAPDGTIMVGTRTQSGWGQLHRIGQYKLGSVQMWRIERDEARARFEVGEQGKYATFEVDRGDLPRLLEQSTLSLSLYASAPSTGSSVAIVRSPTITVPRQAVYGGRVQTPWFRPVVALAGMLSLVWFAVAVRTRLRLPRLRAKELVAVLLLMIASLAVGWRLSAIPGHPFEKRTTLLWSRIAAEHGVGAVIARSMLATEADAHGGQPYEAVGFLYPPLLLYAYWLAGIVGPITCAGQTLKILALTGLAAGGALLFALLRHLGVAPRIATIAMAAYVLNPATIFDAAVWGQTDALVALFLLVGAAGILLKSPPLAWVGILIGLLTKQTGGFFGLIVIVIGFVWFGYRRMISGLPPAVIVIFLLLTPFLLSGIHPSAVYRPIVAAVDVFGREEGTDTVNALVSQGAFTLWSLLTALDGATGLSRQAFPDAGPSRFGLSYFALSRGLFAIFSLLLVLSLARRSRSTTPGVALLAIAAYEVAAVVLLTRTQSRYLHFGILFAIASMPWMTRWFGALIITLLSGTMLVGMWGMLVFTSLWYPGLVPGFDPQQSWLNNAMAIALGSDAGITIGGILNLASLLGLVIAFWIIGRERPLQVPGASVGDQ